MNKRFIVFSVLISIIFAFFIYKSYKNSEEEELSLNETVYFLQIGAYKNSENVSKVTKMVNYNYVEYDNGMYFIYVGITKSSTVLDKLKNLLNSSGTNIYIKEKNINDKEFLEYLEKYDDMIEKTDDIDLINAIEKDILKNYENFFE